MLSASPRLMTIFTEALDQPDAAAQAAYLDRACGEDAELRRRVEALLAAHRGAGRFLDLDPTDAPREPANDPDRTREQPTGDGQEGMVIAGRYTLLEKIGEGGMGEVWVAKQTEPVKRKVALKLIKTGMDSRAVIRRFEQERQALALMDHPEHRPRARRRAHARRPAVLRDGAGQRPAAHQVLRRGQADAPRAAGAVRADLPGGAARPSQGDRAPRPQAGQHPGDADRRQAGAQGHRLRRRQGDGRQADRRIALHPVRRGGRHARVHVARAGGVLRRGHRHPRRHLFARRDPLRTADRTAADRRRPAEEGGAARR